MSRGVLADIGVVATCEVQQALRKRLLIVLLLGYATATGAAHWGFVQGLKELEGQVAVAMGVSRTERPGALIAEVLKSKDLRHFLGDLVGDSARLDALLDVPVLALWSGAVAMVLLPVFLMASTSTTVSVELETRSIRFLALRTERLPIVLGKLAGQLVMGALAGLAGVVVTELVGLTLMVQVPPVALATGSLEHMARAMLFALPYAGLGLCVSQWLARANVARVVALVVLVAITIANPVLSAYADASPVGRLADLTRLLLPGTGWGDVWQDDPLALALTAARMVVVTVAWVALGYWRFDRRDL